MTARGYEPVLGRLDSTVRVLPRMTVEDASQVLRAAVCTALVELGAQPLCQEVLVEVLAGGVLHLRLSRAVAGALGLHDPEVRAVLQAGAWPALAGMVRGIVGVGSIAQA